MAVASHPLRITERDVIKEQSVDEWFNSFQGLDLHIRVLGARDLSPKSGLPDPYCKVVCGPAKHRTVTQRRTLDPTWGEEFYLEWAELSSGKRLVTVEVWDWDFWRPDELLGRGFVDINGLAFEPLEVLELDLKLYPSSVHKPQDVKPPKSQKPKQPSKKQLQQAAKKQQQQQRQQTQKLGNGSATEQQQQLQPAPSFSYLLQGLTDEDRTATAAGDPGPTGQLNPPVSAQQQQQQSQQKQQEAAAKAEKQVKQKLANGKELPQLGSVRVALWWAPTRRAHAFDVAERVSFCLLPGEVKVPPVVTHTKLGTLYEEPCVVYIKVSLLEVHLGGSWYLEYLRQRSKKAPSPTSQLIRNSSSGADLLGDDGWAGFSTGPAGTSSSSSSRLLERSESLEAALAAVSNNSGVRRRHSLSSSSASSPRFGGGHHSRSPRGEGWESPRAGSSLFDVLGASFGSSGSSSSLDRPLTPAEELRQQQRQQQLLQQHLAAEPVFALARLRFGKQQCAESIPVRLRPGGAAVFREQFVFATKRPLQHKRVVLEVVLRGKGLPGGSLVARGEWSLVELLRTSPAPPTTWLGVLAARRNQVPGLRLNLQGIDGSSVDLIAAAADADGRAAMYGVPAIGKEAALAAGLSVGSSTCSTPRRGHTPRMSMDLDVWQQQQQQQEQQQQQQIPWLTRLLSKQVGWRCSPGESTPSSPGRSPLSRSSSARHPNTPSHISLGSSAATATAVASARTSMTDPSCEEPSAAATAATAVTTATAVAAAPSPSGASTPTAAAAAAAAAAIEAATKAATTAAAAAGDVALPDELSPIPGLPVRPEPGGLSGPLATLQLVLHRVELVPEPTKGWFVVLKVGQHWARSRVRRDADFSWQLSVPIYHPTTTLVMVVYCEAGRGKITFLGKLHYRISYLLYLNHREVVKSLKLRAGGGSNANSNNNSNSSQSQGMADPNNPAGAGGKISGVVLLGFTCSIPDRKRLLNAYERSPYPPMVHQVSLFHAAKRDDILQRHHQKVVAWLSTAADPAIPPVVAWKVLETGRESFKLSRSRHNIQRLKVATSWIPAMWGYFTDLKAWVRPWHNIASVFVMGCVCFYPRFSLFVFLLWRSVVALRRLLMHGFVEYLGVDLGELFDSAGLLPSDFLYDDEDDDDDAASTASGSSTGSGTWGGGNAGSSSNTGQPGAGGWGGGGGVRDLAAVMMFQPRRLQRLKRRYEQLLRISLQVQNRIDDIAMAFERLHAMVTGQDPLATALFFWRCLILATALWLLGPGPLLFCWWCWEVLRPPSWRKPPGVKGPVQFVINLPSRSLEEG